MKKEYMTPAIKVVTLHTSNAMLVVSGNNKDFTYGGLDTGSNTPGARSYDNDVWEDDEDIY